MTPDMKRLCEAAESAHDDWVKGGYAVKAGEYTIEATPEAIVRAVLTALREPSASTVEAGSTAGIPNPGDPYTPWLEVGDEGAKSAFTNMIDHILSEPATA